MNKKILCVLFAAILTLMASCGRTETEVPSGMQLASVAATDYYMYVPAEWTVADQDGITAAYVSPVDRSNVTCACYTISNSSVFDIPADRDESKADAVIYAENYWNGYTSELSSYLPGYTLVSGPTQTVLDKHAAIRMKYTATLSGTDYTYDMIICIKERMFAYILTYTAESSKYETNLSSFERIAEEFVFQTGVLS